MGHELREWRIDIRRERSGELRLIEEQEPVLGRENRRHGCPRCGILDQLCNRLALVGGEGSDVDEPHAVRHVLADPGFRERAQGVGERLVRYCTSERPFAHRA